jgi:hypothetical protein
MEDRRSFTTDPNKPRCEKCGGETQPVTYRVSTPDVAPQPMLQCKVCGARQALAPPTSTS